MTITPRYLVNDRTLLVSNETGFLTEYRPVYQKNLSVYKGIDNSLEFQLLNEDQKHVVLTGKTPKFVAFDENKNLVIEHDGTVTNSNKGIFTVTVSDNDTLSIKQQYLSYNVYVVDDTTNSKTLTYADEQLNATGTIYVSAQAFPGPSATYNVTEFLQVNDVWQSDAVPAEAAINGNEALHTAVVYTSGYIGTIIVQATLDNQVTEGTDWAEVTTLTFDGSETEPTPVNFNGVYSFLRFEADASPTDTIVKILVRN
jgi:hypothetical protein